MDLKSVINLKKRSIDFGQNDKIYETPPITPREMGSKENFFEEVYINHFEESLTEIK